MSTLVSTGQITIVDNNDAKPITAFITSNISTNQIYAKDDAVITYIPNYATTNLVLSAKVYVGGSTAPVDVTNLSSLTGHKWSTDLTTSIGTTPVLTINTNMSLATPSLIYYYEADYTDPNTGLVSHIIAQIGVNVLQTGTNAIYVQVSGQNIIKTATGTVKNTATMKADLVRASGVDDTGTTYQWYELPSNTPISQATTSNWAAKYGFQTTVQANAGTVVNVGTGVPATSSYTDTKGIVIGEPAVNSLGLYRVECQDQDGKKYQGFFTVYDVSDLYNVKVMSTAGDKLQNGVGQTDVYPVVYYGPNIVTDQSSWTFKWYFYDGLSPGNQAGFIDTTRTAVSTGRVVTTNTAGASAMFTYRNDQGAAITFAPGDMIKVVNAQGTPYYYEVATSNPAAYTVTVRVPATTSLFLKTQTSWNSNPGTDQFIGGKLFVCSGTGVTAGTKSTLGNATTMGAKITVTGYEIDVKGTIVVEAYRP